VTSRKPLLESNLSEKTSEDHRTIRTTAEDREARTLKIRLISKSKVNNFKRKFESKKRSTKINGSRSKRLLFRPGHYPLAPWITRNTNPKNMKTLQCFLAGGLLALLCSAQIFAAPSSFNVNFQNRTKDSTYSESNAEADFRSGINWDTGASLTIKEYDSANGYRGLRVKMLAGKTGGDSGMIWTAPLENSYAYTLEYKVYFESGFQFRRNDPKNPVTFGGGKLPGIAGGSRPTGGNGEQNSGMSGRMMWRHESPRVNPYLELYVYWRGQAGTYGDRFYLQDIAAGKWYTIKERVTLGSTKSAGRIQVWVNGVGKINKEFQFYGSTQNWQLNAVLMDVFYGGSGTDWAPTSNCFLILDNIRADRIAF
jgi:hypothetical protein